MAMAMALALAMAMAMAMALAMAMVNNMRRTQQAYNKLNGKYPRQLPFIWFKGKRISKNDFDNIKGE